MIGAVVGVLCCLLSALRQQKREREYAEASARSAEAREVLALFSNPSGVSSLPPLQVRRVALV
eukprot:4388473-Prymnesium_polylepis.2